MQLNWQKRPVASVSRLMRSGNGTRIGRLLGTLHNVLVVEESFDEVLTVFGLSPVRYQPRTGPQY
jgi:hypothetical protein